MERKRKGRLSFAGKEPSKHTDDLQYKTLANSATVLWNALQSYKTAAEQTVGTDTLQLNADQIF